MKVHELMAAVRQFCAENYPGCRLEYVSIHCRRLAKPIRLSAGPIPKSSQETIAEEEGDHRGLSPIILDVLAILREATRPMSRTLILEELARRGKLYNERSVAGYLAQLVQDGTLENIQEGTKKRGYRLVEEGQ